jgi:hypothetical protein
VILEFKHLLNSVLKEFKSVSDRIKNSMWFLKMFPLSERNSWR